MKYMTNNPGHIQLNRTGLWVPRVEAKQEAINVYSEFSMNIENIENISTLSHIVHSSFNQDEIKKYLSKNAEARLMRHNYLTKPLGELASRLTLKSHVASSMVVAEIDGGTIGGYLVEPFVGSTSLPHLYGIYLKNRRESRP